MAACPTCGYESEGRRCPLCGQSLITVNIRRTLLWTGVVVLYVVLVLRLIRL
jgi:RNA polymerase subunit RPABC4/transcription elongation factor Spt4